MKKIYIIGFLAIAAGILMLVNATKDISTYASFSDATEGQRIKVVGTLSKDKEITYDPEIDENLLSFYMKDNDGLEKKVNYIGAKPQDFEMSESIVITGKMQDQTFISSEMLLKCPSKYKGEEEFVNAQSNG
jgi:cytochrome c-type biogenesis protein CcmE